MDRCILLVILMSSLWLGCRAPASHPTAIAAGMAEREVRRVLQQVHAMPVELESLSETDTDHLTYYELRNGSLLAVAIGKATHQVAYVLVCTNPKQGKSLREWKAFQGVMPGTHPDGARTGQ
jgi:hypothetical protein